jgi:hypothetical protein
MPISHPNPSSRSMPEKLPCLTTSCNAALAAVPYRVNPWLLEPPTIRRSSSKAISWCASMSVPHTGKVPQNVPLDGGKVRCPRPSRRAANQPPTRSSSIDSRSCLNPPNNQRWPHCWRCCWRRVLQMEPSAASDPDATMHLHCPADGRSFVVAAPPESNDAIEALQEGLQSMLFRDVTAMSDASSSSPGDPEQGSIR